MGSATRWFKGMFGIKIKEKDRLKHSGHKSTTIPLKLTHAEVALLRSFYSKSEKNLSRHAIGVATATTAAADTKIATMQEAAVLVPLTVHDQDNNKKLAAVKIQRVYRGHLARRALRALKALVKIQALVRGFLVRKQVATTLRGMQTLIRVQASVRARANKSGRFIHKDHGFAPQYQARKTLEKLDESPKTVEVYNSSRAKSRSSRTNSWVSTPSSKSFGRDFSYRIPTRVSIPETRNCPDRECHLTTNQSTLRLANSCLCNSPAKSVCVESYFDVYGDNPNYMENTKSFMVKSRSFSAPRQIREPGPNTKMSIHEMMQSRNSLRMQRSCSRVEEAINFKNVVTRRL